MLRRERYWGCAFDGRRRARARRYRRIRTSNAKLEAALFSLPGGRELMLACGFTEAQSDELVLPKDVSLVRRALFAD